MLKSSNKKILCFILLMAFLISIAPQVFASTSSDNWAMFRSDPSHSGSVTGNPRLLLCYSGIYTTGNTVESSPAVVAGVVYVGSTDCNVYALSAINGAKLWSYTTGAEIESSPAVAKRSSLHRLRQR